MGSIVLGSSGCKASANSSKAAVKGSTSGISFFSEAARPTKSSTVSSAELTMLSSSSIAPSRFPSITLDLASMAC